MIISIKKQGYISYSTTDEKQNLFNSIEQQIHNVLEATYVL